MADEAGIVHAAVPGLSRRAGVSLAECRKALTVLTEADTESRSPEFGGKRIAAVDGGWLLLNYEKYREIRTSEQVKSARRMRKYRQIKRNSDGESVTSSVTGESPTVADTSPLLQAEADTEAKAEATDKDKTHGPKRGPWMKPYAIAWKAFFGGKIPGGMAAQCLWPLHKEYGERVVLTHLKNYLLATEPKFLNLPKFASTFNAWSGNGQGVTQGKPTQHQRNMALLEDEWRQASG